MLRKYSLRDCLCSAVAIILLAAGTALAESSDATENAATEESVMELNYHIPRTAGFVKPPDQAIPFSHAKHLGTLTLNCDFCHVGAGAEAESDSRTESGKHMTLPGTQVCMNCHVSLGLESPGVAKLTEYHAAGNTLPWKRVYSVLPGVNWTHKPHQEANIDCEHCHGDVAQLEVMSQVTAVTAMASCVDCHRANQASTQCNTCHAWPAVDDFQRWAGIPSPEEN